jgi:hypothetical protein
MAFFNVAIQGTPFVTLCTTPFGQRYLSDLMAQTPTAVFMCDCVRQLNRGTPMLSETLFTPSTSSESGVSGLPFVPFLTVQEVFLMVGVHAWRVTQTLTAPCLCITMNPVGALLVQLRCMTNPSLVLFDFFEECLHGSRNRQCHG